MRTTLDIDESVLNAAKELARRQNKTAGEIISSLARQALLSSSSAQPPAAVQEPPASYGFRPLPAGDTPVTNELVDKLREDLGI